MKIELVPFKQEFLVPFLQWRNEALSVRHNPFKPMSEDEVLKMLESEGVDLSNLKTHETYRWFVLLKGKIVGNVSLKNVSHSMGYAEIGYGVSEEHHGKGIATEAVSLLVKKAFLESPLRKLLAYVHDMNLPSCRVLEKLGFKREGLLREHYLINGRPVNEVLFGLLKSEWQFTE